MGFSTSLAQSDTLRINNQVISTFANEDCGKLEFPNELVMVDVDKQGNGLLAINQKGLIADLDIRIVMAASDDTYLNSLLAQQTGGSPTILSGVLTKNFADQKGNVTSVQLQLLLTLDFLLILVQVLQYSHRVFGHMIVALVHIQLPCLLPNQPPDQLPPAPAVNILA